MLKSLTQSATRPAKGGPPQRYTLGAEAGFMGPPGPTWARKETIR